MKNFIRKFLLNQDEFGANCTVDKHTKISVEIRKSADNIGEPIYWSVST